MTLLDDIVDEWKNGAYYQDSHLCEAFITFLNHHLLGESVTDIAAALEFLESGYRKYVEVFVASGQGVPLVHSAYSSAAAALRRAVQSGAGCVTRAAAAAASSNAPLPHVLPAATAPPCPSELGPRRPPSGAVAQSGHPPHQNKVSNKKYWISSN